MISVDNAVRPTLVKKINCFLILQKIKKFKTTLTLYIWDKTEINK